YNYRELKHMLSCLLKAQRGSSPKPRKTFFNFEVLACPLDRMYSRCVFILWYKQDRGKSLKLLGYLNMNIRNHEEDLEERIRFDGDGRKESTLSVTDLNFNDSALYFCAASYTVL
uniref:Ig-like domain-containing protein n=1 Tax=Gouania willdenowi TaxID=441366 RepID=A0A8C5G1I9_GOUWI